MSPAAEFPNPMTAMHRNKQVEVNHLIFKYAGSRKAQSSATVGYMYYNEMYELLKIRRLLGLTFKHDDDICIVHIHMYMIYRCTYRGRALYYGLHRYVNT